jgi:regulator of RNase E activity RraA
VNIGPDPLSRLVIPMGVAEEVLAKAEELSGKEKLMRKGLGKGQKIRDLFEKHKAF